MVFLILALVWAAFLVPQVLRARAEGSPADSIGAFRKQLSVLQRTMPRPDGDPFAPAAAVAAHSAFGAGMRPRRSTVRKRRRQILVGLLAAMSGTLVLGLIPGLQLFLVAHLAVDVLCGAYVALLIRARNLAGERDAKVRYLPSSARPEPAMLLSRSAN